MKTTTEPRAPGSALPELRFELVTAEAADAAALGFDLGLGGWQTVAPSPGPVSFAASGASGDPAEEAPLLFRLSTKAVDGESTAALAAEAARLSAVHCSLDAVDARVERALRRAARGTTGISYSAAEVSASELQLAEWVWRTRGEARVSFAVESAEQDPGRVQGFLERLWQRMGSLVVIQTRVAEDLIASTRVTWGGDFSVVVNPGARPEQCRLHACTVESGLQQHRAILRIILLTLRQASKLAIAAGIGSWFSALPAAFKFINTLMAELKKLPPRAASQVPRLLRDQEE